MRLRLRVLPLLFICFAVFVFASCVNVAGGGIALSLVTFLVLAFGLGVAACSEPVPVSNNPTNGWDVGEDVRSGDTVELDIDEDDDAGVWESCCKNGVVDSCFCPANMACNYGEFERCSDGTCTIAFQSCPGIEAGASSVEAVRKSVDFPAPLSPITA